MNESLPPERLDPLLPARAVPGVGRGWQAVVGTLTVLCYQLGVFAAQFESLAARWGRERFDLLQPDWASPHNILLAFNTELNKAAACGRQGASADRSLVRISHRSWPRLHYGGRREGGGDVAV